VNRSRPLVLGSAAVAALLANYWLLEDALADRHNFDAAWISDLSTRSESSGGIFVALGIASGVALAAYAVVLLGTLGRRGNGPGGAATGRGDSLVRGGPGGQSAGPVRSGPGVPASRGDSLVRWGVIALLVSAVAIIVAGAAPLSCAEGLEARCNLAEDGVDVVHSIATAAEIGATVLAFALIGWGLARAADDVGAASGAAAATDVPRRTAASTRRRVGILTLVLGALWLALTIVTGVSYLSHGVDGIKGAFQRADQVVFGLWLLALAAGVRSYPPMRGISANSGGGFGGDGG
jgi:hypothetical protein